MKIVGCDLHTRYQQIAMLDTETGELTALVRVSLRHLLEWIVSSFRSREDLVLENLALALATVSHSIMADVPQKPSRGHCCGGLFHRPNAYVWCSVLLFGKSYCRTIFVKAAPYSLSSLKPSESGAKASRELVRLARLSHAFRSSLLLQE